MSPPASLLVRLCVLGALASVPAGAAEPAKAPAVVKAPAPAKAPAAVKAPAATKAPAAVKDATKAAGTPGTASPAVPGGKTPQSVSDLAIASMEDDDDDWQPTALPFTWDVPHAVDVIPMSDVMEANGFPVKLSAVLSTDRPEAILQHLVDRFEAAGLYIAPVETQPQVLREPQLTALDPMGLITYTFILQPNGNGTTTVILGETNVGKRKKPPPSDVAPVMPGATGVLQSRQEAARLLAYSVSASQADAKAFYVKELGRLGYQESEPGVWHKASEELAVSFHPGEGGQTAVLIIRRSAALPVAPGRVAD